MSNRLPAINLGVVEHTPDGGQGARRSPVVVDDGMWAFAVPKGEEDVVDAEVVGVTPPPSAVVEMAGNQGGDMAEKSESEPNTGVPRMDGLPERKLERPVRRLRDESQVAVTDVADSYKTLKRHLRPWLTDELLDRFRGISSKHGRTDEDLHRILKGFDGEFLKRLGLPLNDEMIDGIDIDNPGGLGLLINAKLEERREELSHADYELWLNGLWPAMSGRDKLIEEERRAREKDRLAHLPPPPAQGAGDDNQEPKSGRANTGWEEFRGLSGKRKGVYAGVVAAPSVAANMALGNVGMGDASNVKASLAGLASVAVIVGLDHFKTRFFDKLSSRRRTACRFVGSAALSLTASEFFTGGYLEKGNLIAAGVGTGLGAILNLRERSRAKLNAEPVLTKPDSWWGRRQAERRVKEHADSLVRVGSEEEKQRRDEKNRLRGASVLTAPGRRVSPGEALAAWEALAPEEKKDILLRQAAGTNGGNVRRRRKK